jgi:dimethylaniline monooxygenase (N-oxide forming)
MHFPNNGRVEAQRIQQSVVKPDVVIFATGYLPSFPYLNTPDNHGSKPYPVAFDANVRHIWKDDDPTIGFIGFVRPGFGAIPPLAEMQAMLFTMNLLNRVPNPLNPEDEWHFRLLHPPDSRVSYGVEHDSYAYQLAKDMNGAPSFTEVLKTALVTPYGWRLPWVWAAGSSFNTKFRMRGPWKDDRAAEILTTEMWETISRRKGLFGKFQDIQIFLIILLTLRPRKHPSQHPPHGLPRLHQPLLLPLLLVLGHPCWVRSRPSHGETERAEAHHAGDGQDARGKAEDDEGTDCQWIL